MLLANATGWLMIRGAIEVATPRVVQGWLHYTARSLAGETILAFVGLRCIGSGRIDTYRHDLVEAGLGDGTGGFAVEIWLESDEQAGSVVVKLEHSDLLLLQTDAEVVARRSASPQRA